MLLRQALNHALSQCKLPSPPLICTAYSFLLTWPANLALTSVIITFLNKNSTAGESKENQSKLKSPEGAAEAAVVVAGALVAAVDVLEAHVTEETRAAMHVALEDILPGTVDMDVNLVMGNEDVTEGG